MSKPDPVKTLESKDCPKCDGGDMQQGFSLAHESASTRHLTGAPVVNRTGEMYDVLKCRECGHSEPIETVKETS